MVIERGQLIGGYTIRVLRDRMPIDERKVFDEQLPFTIE